MLRPFSIPPVSFAGSRYGGLPVRSIEPVRRSRSERKATRTCEQNEKRTMYIHLYQVEKEHELYEERIQAHLLHQAIRRAKRESAQTSGQPVSPYGYDWRTLWSRTAGVLRHWRTWLTQPQATS
jgi:hypothetical protein